MTSMKSVVRRIESAISRLDALLDAVRVDAEWKESDHPRAENGQFGSGGGASAADPVNSDQAAALKHYTAAAYRAINGHLRGGKVPSEADKSTIGHLDSLLGAASLPADTTVYRGLGSLAVQQLFGPTGKVKAGQIIEDPGFLSSTTDENVSRRFFAINPAKNILMKINAPKGSSALDVSKYSDDPSEKEVLIARGARLKVVRFDPKSRKLEVELMPRHHDTPKGNTKSEHAQDAATTRDDKFSYDDAVGLVLHPSEDRDAETFYLA